MRLILPNYKIMKGNDFTQSSLGVIPKTTLLTLETLQQICPGYRYRSPWINIEYISWIFSSTSDALCLEVSIDYYKNGELLAQMCARQGWELVADRFGSWEIFIPWSPFPVCVWGGCTVENILNRIDSTDMSFEQWLTQRQMTGQTLFPPRWSKQWLSHAS